MWRWRNWAPIYRCSTILANSKLKPIRFGRENRIHLHEEVLSGKALFQFI
jgi:hypothetical protein